MHTDLLPHHHGEEEHHNIDQIRAQLAKADNFQIVADIFKQVGDPSRVRIFWLLCHCEECVQNISALMEMSSPAVSHHLRGLKDNGLIVSRRVGKEVFYKAADTDQSRLLHIMIEKVMAKRYLMNQKQAGHQLPRNLKNRTCRKPRQVRYFYSVQYSPAVLMTGSAASSMFAASRRVSGAS